MAGFRSDRRGNVALIFAVLFPILAVVGVGAVELSYVLSDRTKMQDVADAAALRAATELTLSDPASIKERTSAFALRELERVRDHSSVRVGVSVADDGRSVTVSVNGQRPSFFGNLLPPGGFRTAVSATAMSLNMAPLCVLVHGDRMHAPKGVAAMVGQNLGGLDAGDHATVSAPACLVHSNFDINVGGGASLRASEIQASGVARGGMSPAGESGAPEIQDPFASDDVSIPAGCPQHAPPNLKLSGSETLAPGLHCGGIQLTGDAILNLAPGEHYFVGDVTADQSAQITGDDVVLVFDNHSKFDFSGQSRVSLRGRRSGQLAGFVVITTRTNGQDFHISASHVNELLGTIYIPNAQLVVEGVDNVAQTSEWTVVVARQLTLHGSPTLYINANYAGSSVPVPAGVGPNSAKAQLVH
jgi:hypothetical protein